MTSGTVWTPNMGAVGHPCSDFSSKSQFPEKRLGDVPFVLPTTASECSLQQRQEKSRPDPEVSRRHRQIFEALDRIPNPEQHRSWKPLLRAALEVGVTTDLSDAVANPP